MKVLNIEQVRRSDQKEINKKFRHLEFNNNGCLIKIFDLSKDVKNDSKFTESIYMTLKGLDQQLQLIKDLDND